MIIAIIVIIGIIILILAGYLVQQTREFKHLRKDIQENRKKQDTSVEQLTYSLQQYANPRKSVNNNSDNNSKPKLEHQEKKLPNQKTKSLPLNQQKQLPKNVKS